MSKPKGGLQKKVSSIFDGVPVEPEAARGDIRRPDKPAVPAPSAPAPVARPIPTVTPPAKPVSVPPPPPAVTPAPAAPVAAPRMPTVPPAPTTWPKPPVAQPEAPKPQPEQKPRISLAAAMSADAPAAGTPPRNAPSAPKLETPARPPQPAPERLSPAARPMPKVVVKSTSAMEKRKTAILLGSLATVFVLAMCWSLGLFSGKKSQAAPTPITLQATTKIKWERPKAGLPTRNPMVATFVPSTRTTASEQSGKSASDQPSQYAVSGTMLRGTVWTASVDGVTVKVGDEYGSVRIKAIASNFVEFERVDGVTFKSFVSQKRYTAGSTDVTPEPNSQPK
jgi:hypothetical protein